MMNKMAASYWEEAASTSGTNIKRFSHPLHASTLLNTLNDSRKNPVFCDGVVIVGNIEVPVQKNVLAASSPYFRAVYSYDGPALGPSCGSGVQSVPGATLDIDGLTVAVFEEILDFVYTSSITLSAENIQAILQAADLLLMADLKELCCEYLEQCIAVHNCLGIRDFAERFSCPRVFHAATTYMDEHFSEVSYSEEFLQLPLAKVKDILCRNSLLVQTEDAVFDCVMRWVRYDVTSRCELIEDLITSCVHMGLVDERYLQEYVIADELVKRCELESTVIRLRREDPTPFQRGYSNTVVVTGGEGPDDRDLNVVEIKSSVRCVVPNRDGDARHSGWINLSPMSTARVGHGLIGAGGFLYVVGGRDNTGRILNTGEKYDPSLNTWTAIPPMAHARVGFGLVTIDDRIYAIGGSNDMSDPLTSVEEYNIYTNKWRPLPDMNLKRAWSAFAVASKKIYVIGGGIMGKLYEVVECFDPRSETWSSVAPMRERRFDARAIGIGDDIYVFGGLRRLECPGAMHSGTGMKFCGTEIYSTESKSWRSLNRHHNSNFNLMCTMMENSHIDSVVKYGDEIFVIGDLDVGGVLNCIRAYCPATLTWREVIQNHPASQRGMQACNLKIANSIIHAHMGKTSRHLPHKPNM